MLMKLACYICILILLHLPFQVDGGALRLFYSDIDGGRIDDLTNHPTFPSRPSSVQPITEALEELHEQGDRFGTFIRCYIEAPETGDYIFMLASDDESELWLSPSSNPGQKVRIAHTLGFVHPREYTAKSSQRSESIRLRRGEKYYFEVLHKEFIGYDHISVGWQLPDGSLETPIPATRLMPVPLDDTFAIKEKTPHVLSEIQGQPVATLTNTSAREGDMVTFKISIEANPPPSFQWLRNHKPIPDAILSSYTLCRANLTNNTDLFTVLVSNKFGAIKREAMLSVAQDNEPPHVSASLILSTNKVAVFFSEPVNTKSATNPGHYQVDGIPAEKAVATDRSRLILLTLPFPLTNASHSLTVSKVQDQAHPPNTIVPRREPIEHSRKALNLPGTRRLAFDGHHDAVRLPDGFADFIPGITFAFWAKPTTNRYGARFIEVGNRGKDFIALGRLGDSQNLILDVFERGWLIVNGIEMNAWQHFAASIDRGGYATLYKNGAVLIRGQLGLPKVLTRTNNYLGGPFSPGHEPYEGEMGDVRIYSRALSPDEINILARETVP